MLSVLCVHVCVGEDRAGQEKSGEEKVDITQKTQENEAKRVNTRGGNEVKISVGIYKKKRKKHWETYQNMDSVVSTIWSSVNPKKVRKTFSAEGPIPNG